MGAKRGTKSNGEHEIYFEIRAITTNKTAQQGDRKYEEAGVSIAIKRGVGHNCTARFGAGASDFT
jgi:hypothetical protein